MEMLTLLNLRKINIGQAIHTVLIDCKNPVSIGAFHLRDQKQRREAWNYLLKHGTKA